MDDFQKAYQNINVLLNITDVLTQCLSYHHIFTYAHIIFAYLRDYLTYIKQVATHTMDNVDTAKANILSPDILPKNTRVCLDTLSHNYPQ